MVTSLLFWCEQYLRFKHAALCLDIETMRFNGPIAVIGLYKPQEGAIHYQPYINGINLNLPILKQAFHNTQLLITYNGLVHDIPKIKQQFPGAIPDKLPVIDLYQFARKLELNTNLKVLEHTLNIERDENYPQKSCKPTRLWQRYVASQNPKTLHRLIQYNRQDTINLYPLAEVLIQRVYQRLNFSPRIPTCIYDAVVG